MRLALAATILLPLAFAPAAAAAPQSLARVPESETFALAGDAALVTHAHRRVVRVDRLPLTPGGPRTTVFRRSSAGLGASAYVNASNDLAAVAVLSAERRTGRIIGEEFAGPPSGQWAPLGPPRTMRGSRFVPVFHRIDGTRLFTAELSNTATTFRWVVREPGAEPRPLALPRRTITSAVAGDLIAYGFPDDVIVENWRTGARVASYPVGDAYVQSLAVRADGAVLTADDDGNVVERLPGAPPRRLTGNGAGPAFAGDRVVVIARTRRPGVLTLKVVEPDGGVRPFGVPSADLLQFDADAQRVLWRGNGCLLTAPITDLAAAAPDAGACPRSEVHVLDEHSRLVGRDRRVRIRLDCVAAAPPGCRGTLTLRPAWGPRARPARPQRFRIAVGRRDRLNVRLTRRGYKAVVRANRKFGAAPVFVRTVAVDPDGRRRVQSQNFVIYVR